MEEFKTKIFDWNASFHLFAALLELHFVKTQTHRFFYFVSQAKGQGTTFPLIRRKGSLWKTVSLKPKPSPSPFFSFHPSTNPSTNSTAESFTGTLFSQGREICVSRRCYAQRVVRRISVWSILSEGGGLWRL
jgi:hypothetical protein